jgi:hypothetical protein
MRATFRPTGMAVAAREKCRECRAKAGPAGGEAL